MGIYSTVHRGHRVLFHLRGTPQAVHVGHAVPPHMDVRHTPANNDSVPFQDLSHAVLCLKLVTYASLRTGR